MPKTELEYEIEAKEYISHLDPQAQKLAVKAIEDCLELDRSWRWINTALNKKGYSNWNRWHFGLFFSNNFNASVIETMNREDEAENNNLGEFFAVLDDRKQYTFPQTGEISEADKTKEDHKQDHEKGLPLMYCNWIGGRDQIEQEYDPEYFNSYKLLLDDGAFEKNIPAIIYALDNGDIVSDLVSTYEDALANYAGDLHE